MDKKTKMKTYALKAAKGALTGYKRSLIGRVVLADAAIGGIEKYQRKKGISQKSVIAGVCKRTTHRFAR